MAGRTATSVDAGGYPGFYVDDILSMNSNADHRLWPRHFQERQKHYFLYLETHEAGMRRGIEQLKRRRADFLQAGAIYINELCRPKQHRALEQIQTLKHNKNRQANVIPTTRADFISSLAQKERKFPAHWPHKVLDPRRRQQPREPQAHDFGALPISRKVGASESDRSEKSPQPTSVRTAASSPPSAKPVAAH